MGFRFSIEHANWLAHVLQPTGATPNLENEFEQRETLRAFINSFSKNFYSSRHVRSEVDYFLYRHADSPEQISLQNLREFFRNTPWISLLLPCGDDSESDRLLTNPELLERLVRIRPDDPGLILQLEESAEYGIALSNVFPAFRVALSEVTRWPGTLIWTRDGDAIFLEITRQTNQIWERLEWIFSHLATQMGSPDLELLKRQFVREFGDGSAATSALKIIHLSDLHLGSAIARRRTSRVQSILESVVAELGDAAPIIPLITGDLMDSPSEENLGDVRSFLGFLHGLGLEQPIVLLGNHDVRKDGWLNPKLSQAVNISRSPVVWIEDQHVAIACFNSVNAGRLARGFIGEQEFTHVGEALDQGSKDRENFTVLAALHHHPIPVEIPSWYRQKWYERFLGGKFEKTEALEDATVFLEWLKVRGIQAVFHGHKHIPRFDKYEGIAVVGCGSTFGMVDNSTEGQTYMSLNVITVDRARSMLGCRLRAERIPGAGLESVSSHELVLKSGLTRRH